jgi:hypothetical protein
LPREHPPWRSWLSVTTADGEPWTPAAHKVAAQRQAACTPSRPWREWLTVTTRYGTPWGEPVPNSARIDGWLQKIAVELAEAGGLTADESIQFVECNRELIEARFAARTARADVVQELHELMKSAWMVLAAE